MFCFSSCWFHYTAAHVVQHHGVRETPALSALSHTRAHANNRWDPQPTLAKRIKTDFGFDTQRNDVYESDIIVFTDSGICCARNGNASDWLSLSQHAQLYFSAPRTCESLLKTCEATTLSRDRLLTSWSVLFNAVGMWISSSEINHEYWTIIIILILPLLLLLWQTSARWTRSRGDTKLALCSQVHFTAAEMVWRLGKLGVGETETEGYSCRLHFT